MTLSENITLWLIRGIGRAVLLNNLIILIYHRVLEEPDPYLSDDCDIKLFSSQMQILSKYYNCVSLEEGLTGLQNNRLDKLSVCVTFDDGYADNLRNAAPILKKYSVPATIFVATGYIGNSAMWNDIIIEGVRKTDNDIFSLPSLSIYDYRLDTIQRRLKLVNLLISKVRYMQPIQRIEMVEEISSILGSKMDMNKIMMDIHDVRNLEKYDIQVGAHTVTHPILKTLDAKASLREIVDSRDQVEEMVGYQPRYFAYPNGLENVDYVEKDVNNVKYAGFSAAVTTNRGVSTCKNDIYQLPRLASWGKSLVKYSARINKEYLLAR